MRHLVIIVLSVALYSLNSLADCGALVGELKAMKQAQTTIQISLISNHGLFATTLESYSEALSESGGKAYKTISSNMNNSVSSIRDRGLKAQKTALKLEEATDDLIQRISKCLK
ncbi:MAG: hypothetical protein H7061_02460 [Bdellovibrionaceae bacterium]|nr:hypothetical protein [Bdellovibrio sp.]